MIEYSNEHQEKAIEVLSDLVKENKKLKNQLILANRFTLLMLMSDEVHKSKEAVYFFNKYYDTEEIEKVLPHFNFIYHANNSFNKVDDKFISSIKVLEYNGTPFPSSCDTDRIKERVKEILKSNFQEIYTDL